jgi:hypothetical protein
MARIFLEESGVASSIAEPAQGDVFQFLRLVPNGQDKLFFSPPASPNPFDEGEMDLDGGANSDRAAQEKEGDITFTGISAALQGVEAEDEDDDAGSRNEGALESRPSTRASRTTTTDSEINPSSVSSVGKRKRAESAVSKSAERQRARKVSRPSSSNSNDDEDDEDRDEELRLAKITDLNDVGGYNVSLFCF